MKYKIFTKRHEIYSSKAFLNKATSFLKKFLKRGNLLGAKPLPGINYPTAFLDRIDRKRLQLSTKATLGFFI